jgi:ribosomal protein L37E
MRMPHDLIEEVKAGANMLEITAEECWHLEQAFPGKTPHAVGVHPTALMGVPIRLVRSPRASQAVRSSDVRKSFCGHCGSTSFDDRRGNCSCCGAPRPEVEFKQWVAAPPEHTNSRCYSRPRRSLERPLRIGLAS